MTLAAVLIGYVILLFVAGLFGFYLGTKPDVVYEKNDLTKRGENPKILLGFRVNPGQDDRESLPPTRPEGMRR